MSKYRYIKLDEKWLNKLRETAHFFSADIVCGAGTDWVLKTAEAENKTLFEVVSYLENALSEDVVEVRHGEWIEPSYGELQCSACGIIQEDYPQLYDFCPFCGANMRGKIETQEPREASWHKNMEFLRSGGFGSMDGNESYNTLLRYWQAQEQAGYPKASENVAYFREFVERSENGR